MIFVHAILKIIIIVSFKGLCALGAWTSMTAATRAGYSLPDIQEFIRQTSHASTGSSPTIQTPCYN